MQQNAPFNFEKNPDFHETMIQIQLSLQHATDQFTNRAKL